MLFADRKIDQSQASEENVSTVNSDVCNSIILCPALHGDHWCLVVIEMKQKRMTIYLDFLCNGVGALTAFTRFTNFLECVFVSQSKVIDW